MTINFALLFWPENLVLRRKLAPIGMLLLFALWNLYAFGLRRQDWPIYVFTASLIAVVALLEFVLFRLGPGPPTPPTALDWLGAKFGRGMLLGILFFLIGGSLSGLSGTASGETEKNYLVFSDTPNVAVIRIYEDRILAVPFDRKTKVLMGKVIIQKLDKEHVSLTLEKDIGPLIRSK